MFFFDLQSSQPPAYSEVDRPPEYPELNSKLEHPEKDHGPSKHKSMQAKS